jgi:hypothetical protein
MEETGWLVATNQKSEQIVKCYHQNPESEQRVGNFPYNFVSFQKFSGQNQIIILATY